MGDGIDAWVRQSQDDGSHHVENAGIACNRLGLDPSLYREAMHEIILEWEQACTARYLAFFAKPGILKICHTPEDFREISSIVLPYFVKIRKQSDGSMQFAQALFDEIKAERITNLQDLAHICQKVFEQNEAFRASDEGQRVGRRDGKQYSGYVSTAIRELLDSRAGVELDQ